MNRTIALGAVLVFVVAVAAIGQGPARKPAKRAAPPKFTPEETKGVFFDNVFDGKVLNGGRPTNFAASSGNSGSKSPSPTAPSDTSPAAGAGVWSKIVSASSIEDEIKSIKQLVDKDVTTPTDFAGKGYKECRRHFTLLAMLFGVIGEYDGDVRWKGDAAAARDVFARTAANAKVGTSQVYNEAKLRKTDLQEMLGGGGLPNKGAAEANAKWAEICDRSPLMQRLEMGIQPRLSPWTANPADFKSKKDEILKEAEIVAAIAEVLMKDGMSDADADDYKGFCASLKKAALDAADAVRLDNADAARQAVGQMSKSCDACHGAYR